MTIKEYREKFIELYKEFSKEHDIQPHVEVTTTMRRSNDTDLMEPVVVCRIYLDERN